MIIDSFSAHIETNFTKGGLQFRIKSKDHQQGDDGSKMYILLMLKKSCSV